MAKKKAAKKTAPKRVATSRKSATARDKSAKKVVKKKPVSSKSTTVKPTTGKVSPAKQAVPARVLPEPEIIPVEAIPMPAARKKGVRKATLTTGIRTKKPMRQLGRSRIPVDAPLDVVFQNDLQAREAFMFLGVHTIRELEKFHPDDLVMRLTSPAKQTVGRIRKILAMNNRCLEGDESFALEYQESLNPTQISPGQS